MQEPRCVEKIFGPREKDVDEMSSDNTMIHVLWAGDTIGLTKRRIMCDPLGASFFDRGQ
jgi:hypothetical protein